nr:proteasome subunit beta type-5 [Quercus suber]
MGCSVEMKLHGGTHARHVTRTGKLPLVASGVRPIRACRWSDGGHQADARRGLQLRQLHTTHAQLPQSHIDLLDASTSPSCNTPSSAGALVDTDRKRLISKSPSVSWASEMNSLVARYSRPAFQDEGYNEEDHQQLAVSDVAPPLSLNFALPPIASPAAWLRAMTDDYSNPNCPIKIAHGTTTLAFRFKGGIIVATDSRASAGNWIASQTVKKILEINSALLGTLAGGAADCQYWMGYLGMQCRLHELRHKRRISVAAASKILANLVYSYKGMGLSMGTMCAGVTPTEGPALYYIDSDGTRLAGNLFCVGSGQTFAYGVLDAEYKYDLEDDVALELGKRSILAATHRDAFSGGYINLYHVKEEGWVRHGFMDTNPYFYEMKLKKGEFSNVTEKLA